MAGARLGKPRVTGPRDNDGTRVLKTHKDLSLSCLLLDLFVPKELYSQSYDAVGVMFASIPGFVDFYSQTEMNNQGVECLRLLNEIIADFDELLGEDRFQDIEKMKTIGSTYMATSGLSPEKQPCEDKWEHLCPLADFSLALTESIQEINKHSFNNFELRIVYLFCV
ncbi:hypothetical protein H8959_014415 [Pygathrix nigripes]